MSHSSVASPGLLDGPPNPTTSLSKQETRLSTGACERCHRYKEKCSFRTGQEACSRCKALGQQCHPRPRKRMGRRPVAQKLPYGTTSVMQLVEDSQSHSVNPISGGKFISDNVTLTSLTGHPHRRCRRSDVRIPYPNTAAPVDATARTGLHYGPPSFHALRLPLQGSWQVHQLIDTAEGFFQVHRTFMLGRSFVDGFQSVVRRLFARSPQVLTDAYSVAFRLMSARHATFPSLDGDDLAIGARCLRSLMAESSSIKHPEDAAVIILLGQALLVYNTLIPSPTTQVITRGTLLSVKHWYSALVKRPYLDAVTLTPVLVDTVECLVRRDMPVVRLPTPDRCIIDRFLGVCSSLLPLLYDLCERSYQAKTNGFQEHSSPSNPDRHDTYSDIERKIRDWAPELPPCFFTTFSALEVSVMLAQARSYRLATLLVIHRLRFPLGVNDRVGQYYAGDILRELSILKTWPSDEATGLGLDFPLLVATLEMPGPGMDIYKAFEPLRFRQQHSEMILDFIRFVTAARDTGYTGLWFDLLQDQLQGVTIT